MNKVLFACLHRPDRSPSQRFRFEQYLHFLNDNGWICEQSYLLNQEDDAVYYQPGNYFGKSLILLRSTLKRFFESRKKDFDIVFVQREAYMLGTSVFEKRYARNAKLIFDFDDAIWMHQQGETRSSNKNLAFLKRPSKTIDLIKIADMVFAGNNHLKEFALQYNTNVKIIPTTIDTGRFRKKETTLEKNGRVCIGWTGSFSTIKHFESATPVLRKIKEKYGDQVYFKVIGDQNYEDKELGIKGIPWNPNSELEDLAEIDIGIMPLPNNEWTLGKCGLKGLQYMALEIPSVLSSVGVNTDIIIDGENGFLADKVEEWVEKLSLLIDNVGLRETLGKKGRETVVNKYSVEANKHLYDKFFREVLN